MKRKQPYDRGTEEGDHMELRNLSRPFVLSWIAKHEPVRPGDIRERIDNLPVTLSLGPHLTLEDFLILMERQQVLRRDQGKLRVTDLGRQILREVDSPLLDQALG